MNSKIILAKGINMDRDYNNVINYSEVNLLALLRSSSHFVKEKSDYSFIRDKGYIDTQFTYADALSSNYMAFQNPDYSNKWFFAWIDDVEYRGNYNTRIHFTIDAWSTWFNKITPKKCFINRQHVNDDTIGANRVPENLAINDIIELSETIDYSLTDFYVVVESDWMLNENSTGLDPADTGKQFAGITAYNRQISGHQYLLFDPGTNDITTHNVSLTYWLKMCKMLYLYILRTNVDGHINDLKNIFIIPKACVKPADMNVTHAYSGTPDPDESELYGYKNIIVYYTLAQNTTEARKCNTYRRNNK